MEENRGAVDVTLTDEEECRDQVAVFLRGLPRICTTRGSLRLL